MAEIVLIDDDKRLTSLLTDYLTKNGYSVTSFNNPLEGLEYLSYAHAHCIILDIMMPEKDGLTLCREIRDFSQVPIIMLTARGEVTDRVVGLELGADDYMAKPFEPRELLARIEAVLRRTSPGQVRSITLGQVTIDSDRHRVTVDNRQINCTSLEFNLLSVLMENPGIVLSRDRIIERLKGLNDDVFDRSIDVLISRLRQKIGDSGRSPRFIETVRGAGYRFITS